MIAHPHHTVGRGPAKSPIASRAAVSATRSAGNLRRNSFCPAQAPGRSREGRNRFGLAFLPPPSRTPPGSSPPSARPRRALKRSHAAARAVARAWNAFSALRSELPSASSASSSSARWVRRAAWSTAHHHGALPRGRTSAAAALTGAPTYRRRRPVRRDRARRAASLEMTRTCGPRRHALRGAGPSAARRGRTRRARRRVQHGARFLVTRHRPG
jgi:hypothetical protein